MNKKYTKKAAMIALTAVITAILIASSGCIEDGQHTKQNKGEPMKSDTSEPKIRNNSVNTVSGTSPSAASETRLPDPTVTGNSVELCLNSRVSDHGGWSGRAPDQWLGNVLWASGKAPVTGSHMNIYVTTPDGRYLYDPDIHLLTDETSGSSDPAAFIINFDRELDFDAGTCYTLALLASVSLWNGTQSQLASCPIQTNLYFGIRNVRGLTSELVVHSSNGSLPDPEADGDNHLEDVLADLKYTRNLTQKNLSLQELSQILWAGYGCTPHTTYNGRGGLTVPSWCAEYFLTGRIYIAKEDGVFRYHNRNPDHDLTTRDHRIEKINPSDVRAGLQSAADLPSAPCYIILCLDEGKIGMWYARLETGFVAGSMLVQASALDLGCCFETKLESGEQEEIQSLTGIPASDIPHAIVSIGGISRVHNIDTGHGYSSIQQAIDDDQTADGHTIHADDGLYCENVVVDKQIILTSILGDAVVTALDAGEHAFNVTVNRVNITGFTITGATGNDSAGVCLYGVSYCNISDNNVLHNDLGIYLCDSDNSTIANNNISNNTCGVRLFNSDNNRICNNSVVNNTG